MSDLLKEIADIIKQRDDAVRALADERAIPVHARLVTAKLDIRELEKAVERREAEVIELNAINIAFANELDRLSAIRSAHEAEIEVLKSSLAGRESCWVNRNDAANLLQRENSGLRAEIEALRLDMGKKVQERDEVQKKLIDENDALRKQRKIDVIWSTITKRF